MDPSNFTSLSRCSSHLRKFAKFHGHFTLERAGVEPKVMDHRVYMFCILGWVSMCLYVLHTRASEYVFICFAYLGEWVCVYMFCILGWVSMCLYVLHTSMCLYVWHTRVSEYVFICFAYSSEWVCVYMFCILGWVSMCLYVLHTRVSEYATSRGVKDWSLLKAILRLFMSLGAESQVRWLL